MFMPSITISNLSWSTPDGRAVLSGSTFSFQPERTGIVGAMVSANRRCCAC
jgi:hypothetical protein